MTDFAKHQAALRESQGRAYSVNDAPMCEGMCLCDPRESDEVDERRRDWRGVFWLAVACLGIVLALWAWQNRASAAERSRPHDLWLLVKPTAITEPEASQQRNVFKIGVGYRDHSACEAIKAAMRRVAGTLQCVPTPGR